MSRRVLCFDFGASGGRAMIAEYDSGKITLNEVHRFKNRSISVNGTLYWDILALYNEIRTGLVKANKAGGFESIGIDTWGVDYGIIDENGYLMSNPIQYRDKRTSGMVEKSAELLPPDKLYELTGNQIMEINTAFQLLAEKEKRPYILENGEALLPTPDLLAYMLTGEVSAELSIASTTQLFSPEKLDWSDEAIAAFGLPRKLFPKFVRPGESKGMLSKELCEELNIPQCEVAAVCGHDTQCAAFAAPAKEEDYIFLSSGTWSLFGTVLDKPLVTKKAAELNVTNEVGYGGKVTFLKNITGLWLVQETKAYLESKGEEHSFAELERLAREADGFKAFVDTDAEEFSVQGDMPSRIREYCKKTGQNVPATLGEIMRTIYLSLAMKYRAALDQIRECTGKEYKKIYIVGGGTRDTLLSQLTADVCGIPVTAGPVEATVMGNAAMQLLRCGAILNESEVADVIRRSEELNEFAPAENYDKEYENYKNIINGR